MPDTGINISTVLVIVQIVVSVLLTIVLIIITALYRRDSKRAMLISLFNVLSILKKESAESIIAHMQFKNSKEAKEGDEEYKKGLANDLQMARQRLDALSEFYDKALIDIDKEWKLNGNLYQSFKK